MLQFISDLFAIREFMLAIMAFSIAWIIDHQFKADIMSHTYLIKKNKKAKETK